MECGQFSPERYVKALSGSSQGLGQTTAQRQSRYDAVMKACLNINNEIFELESLCERIVGPVPAVTSDSKLSNNPDPQNIAFLLDCLPNRLCQLSSRISDVRARLDNALL